MPSTMTDPRDIEYATAEACKKATLQIIDGRDRYPAEHKAKMIEAVTEALTNENIGPIGPDGEVLSWDKRASWMRAPRYFLTDASHEVHMTEQGSRFAPYIESLTAAGLRASFWHTGGGCTAIGIMLGDEGAEYPHAMVSDMDGPWTAYLYTDEDNEEGTHLFTHSVPGEEIPPSAVTSDVLEGLRSKGVTV